MADDATTWVEAGLVKEVFRLVDLNIDLKIEILGVKICLNNTQHRSKTKQERSIHLLKA